MNVFFVSYGGGHAPAVIPVIQALTMRGHKCEYLALTTARKTALDAGIPCRRVSDFIDPGDQEIAYWGKRLAETHHTDGKGIAYEESVAYLGVSFVSLMHEIGEEKAWQAYEEKGLNAFCAIEFMRTVLREIEPDMVVATTSPRMERAAMVAADMEAIPSLCMVELFGIIEHELISRADNGKYMALSREDTRQRLIRAGRIPSHLHMTGSPMFDAIQSQPFKEQGKAWRARHHVPNTTRAVLWAEQPEPSDPELPRQVRFHLAEICARHGWQLIVRLHPSSMDPEKETMPPHVIVSDASESIHAPLSAADTVITLTSTVGWEALLADKPLLIIRISQYKDMVSFGDADGAYTIDRLDETEQALIRLATDEILAETLQTQRQALPKAGNATQKVLALIEEIVSKEAAA